MNYNLLLLGIECGEYPQYESFYEDVRESFFDNIDVFGRDFYTEAKFPALKKNKPAPQPVSKKKVFLDKVTNFLKTYKKQLLLLGAAIVALKLVIAKLKKDNDEENKRRQDALQAICTECEEKIADLKSQYKDLEMKRHKLLTALGIYMSSDQRDKSKDSEVVRKANQYVTEWDTLQNSIRGACLKLMTDHNAAVKTYNTHAKKYKLKPMQTIERIDLLAD